MVRWKCRPKGLLWKSTCWWSAAVKENFQFSFGHWVQPGTWDTGGLSGRLLQALGFGGTSTKSAGGAGGTGKSFNGTNFTFLPTRRAWEAMRTMMVSSMWTLMLALDCMKWRRCMIPICGVWRHYSTQCCEICTVDAVVPSFCYLLLLYPKLVLLIWLAVHNEEYDWWLMFN